MIIDDSFIERVNRLKEEFPESRFIFGIYFIKDFDRIAIGLSKIMSEDKIFTSKIQELTGEETNKELMDILQSLEKYKIPVV